MSPAPSTREAAQVRALRLVNLAAGLGVVALLLMMLSIVHPTHVTVLTAMIAGQTLGILAFFCYLLAIVSEMRRNQRLSKLEPQGESRAADPPA